MKKTSLLLVLLFFAISITTAQTKKSTTSTKKVPKKAYVQKKKTTIKENKTTINPEPVKSYDKYTDGYWNYRLEQSSSREYDYGSNTTYYVVLSVNGEKISSHITYTEYYDYESGDTSVSLSVNNQSTPGKVNNPKEWLKEELKYYIRREYGGNNFNF